MLLVACQQAAATDGSATVAVASSDVSAPSTASAAPDPCAGVSCHDIERCEAGKCVAQCPEGEVYVAATGPDGFVMGDTVPGIVHVPPHTVVLTKPYCMDATEVTVSAYKKCVDAGACEAPRIWGMWINYPKLPNHPINKVSWTQARTYCAHRRQSLPTEAQWEWAASGGKPHKWAWGNEKPTCAHADYTPGILETPSSNDGCNGGGTSPVGSASPKGDRVLPTGRIHDLSGNVWEWCLDNYFPLDTKAEVDPTHLVDESGPHVVRGGGWNRSGRGIRVHYRGGSPVDYQVPGLGFRCVRNPG